jgi:hypothetical protein
LLVDRHGMLLASGREALAGRSARGLPRLAV